MPDWIRIISKFVLLGLGGLVIYMIINTIIDQVNDRVQHARNNITGAQIVETSLSATPFGDRNSSTKRGKQIFYNLVVHRTEGEECFVKTSWRWVLHLPTGNSVMWNKSDGEFYAGDKSESLSQAVMVPDLLIPGHYTLSRLAIFKCGNVEDFARNVRNIDVDVE